MNDLFLVFQPNNCIVNLVCVYSDSIRNRYFNRVIMDSLWTHYGRTTKKTCLVLVSSYYNCTALVYTPVIYYTVFYFSLLFFLLLLLFLIPWISCGKGVFPTTCKKQACGYQGIHHQQFYCPSAIFVEAKNKAALYEKHRCYTVDYKYSSC